MTLYPAKTATVAELLEEARKHMTLSENGSGKLRSVTNGKFNVEYVLFFNSNFIFLSQVIGDSELQDTEHCL